MLILNGYNSPAHLETSKPEVLLAALPDAAHHRIGVCIGGH